MANLVSGAAEFTFLKHLRARGCNRREDEKTRRVTTRTRANPSAPPSQATCRWAIARFRVVVAVYPTSAARDWRSNKHFGGPNAQRSDVTRLRIGGAIFDVRCLVVASSETHRAAGLRQRRIRLAKARQHVWPDHAHTVEKEREARTLVGTLREKERNEHVQTPTIQQRRTYCLCLRLEQGGLLYTGVTERSCFPSKQASPLFPSPPQVPLAGRLSQI